MRTAYLCWLVCLTALLGCGGDEDPCGDLVGAEATVRLGTGERSFEPLASGGTVVAHRGIQNGFHVFGSIEATGFYPGPDEEIERYFGDSGATSSVELRRRNPRTSYALTGDGGTVLADWTVQEPLLPEGETMMRSGDVVFLELGVTAEDLNGQVADFEVTVTDLCGQEAMDEVVDLTLTVVE